jgi:peptidyl-tRNA hydrolase
VGIGRPETDAKNPDKESAVIDYVLKDFTREEKKTIDAVIPQASEAIVSLLAEGLTKAMNRYN